MTHSAENDAWREPPEGWFTFGTHVDQPVRLEFSDEVGEDLLPLWERPIPPDGCACGHPSDDHDDEGACMHLCDCAWPIPPEVSHEEE